MDDTKEKSFTRAMLRRLNVLFAKCTPKGHFTAILNGSQLSDSYEGSQKIGSQKKHAPKQQHHQKLISYHVVKSTERAKPDQIVEQSMEPPVIEAEFCDT
jgi:hypothetical protein